jgi:phosphatidylglycerophosphatase A
MSRLVATVLGLGHLRPAPGSWASLAALLAAIPLLGLGGPWLLVAAIALAVALGLWAIGRELAPGRGPADPPWVVIDEVAGQWIALLPVGFGAAAAGVPALALWPGWLAAFVLFRLFDICKPGPVGWADRRPGAAGVMLDDLVAGGLAALGVLALAALAHGVPMR